MADRGGRRRRPPTRVRGSRTPVAAGFLVPAGRLVATVARAALTAQPPGRRRQGRGRPPTARPLTPPRPRVTLSGALLRDGQLHDPPHALRLPGRLARPAPGVRGRAAGGE